MALKLQQAASQRPLLARAKWSYRGLRAGREQKGNQETWEAQAFPIRTMSGDEGPRLMKVPWPTAAARSHLGSKQCVPSWYCRAEG